MEGARTDNGEADRPAAGGGRDRWWVLVAAITVAGAVPRLIAATQSLAWDELYMYALVHGNGFGQMLDAVADTEKTPPLGFILGWLGDSIGSDPRWLRLPAVIAGVAVVPLTAMLARRAFGNRAGIAAAALAAANPMLVFYSSEARSYALTAALCVASTVFLLSAVRNGSRRDAALYSVVSAAALMSHYTAIGLLVAQAVVAFLLWPDRRRLVAAAQAGPVLATAAWLPGLSTQVGISDDELSRIDAIAPLSPDTVADVIARNLIGHPGLGETLDTVPGAIGSTLIGAGLAIALIAAIRGAADRRGTAANERDRRVLWLVLTTALATPLLAIAVSSQPGQSILFPRNLMASLPAALVLVAALLTAGPRGWRVIAPALVTAGLAVGTTISITEVKRPAIRPAALAVAERWEPGDRILYSCCLAGGRGPLGTAVEINLPERMRSSVRVTSHDRGAVYTEMLGSKGRLFVIGNRLTKSDRNAPESERRKLRWFMPLEEIPPAGFLAEFRGEPVFFGEGYLDTLVVEYSRRKR